MKIAAIVIGRVVLHLDQDGFRVWVGDRIGSIRIVPTRESLIIHSSRANIINHEEVSVIRVIGMEGDAEESLFAARQERFATIVDDLIEIKKDSFCRCDCGDIRDEFEVSGFLTNKETSGLSGGTAEAER